jgi:hypothetical protein
MASLDQIAEALKRADAAGNVEDARALAQAYKAAQASGGEPSVNMSVTDAFARKKKTPPAAPQGSLMGATSATIEGLINGIPILGPLAQGATDMLISGGSALAGQDPRETYQGIQERRQANREANTPAFVAGNVGGMIGSYGGLAKLPGMAKALGFEGNLGQRVVNSGASALGIGAADSMVRGERPADAISQNALPALASAAIPLAGAGLRAAGKGLNKAVVQPVARAFNQDNAAIKAVGNNILKDAGRPGIAAAEEAALAKAGGEAMNIDRFGDSIRRLGRAAANVSTEAGNALRSKAQERFYGQSGRAQTFLKTLMNGATDDLALQDALNEAAKRANSANYGKAYNAPAARAVWNQPIKELMQSDTFQSAIKMAEKRGTDRAAVAGVRAVRNPFEFRPDGSVTLRQNADGSRALPSLQFWDQVKRNIDGMIGTAKRQGDNTLVADLTQIKTKLTGALDAAVPDYKKARGVAASFFGADDAIDAGRKAAKSSRSNPEIERAVNAMSKAERDAFSVGFTSEILDALREKTLRNDVITQIFGSPAAKQRLLIALGPQKAREFEAYVRAEQIIDQARVALSGNSTTAQQLIDAGIVGGAGVGSYFMSGGDLSQAGGVAFLALAGRRGMALLGKRVDENVMKKVAEMLASSDPAQVQRAIQNASLSKQHMDALEAIFKGISIATRGAVASTGAMAVAN